MSDFYTFVTEIIPGDHQEIEQVFNKIAEEQSFYVTKMALSERAVYFTGWFKNLGGGPWEEVFDFPLIKFVVLREDGVVWYDPESKPSDVKIH